MNTYTSVYAWPSHLLCPSLKNWWHKKGVTFHTDVDRSSFVHSSNILRGFIAFFFLVLIFELHRHCSGPWTDWKLVSGPFDFLIEYPCYRP